MSLIPEHAKLVFKGEIFDTYQWQQTMFDGSTATFERLKRPNTVFVLAMENGQIVYTKQEQPDREPFLSLLGGRAETGEEPLETAKRELLEESGLQSDNWSLLSSHPFGGKIDWTVYYYVARDCRTVAAQNLDAGEKINLCYADIDTFITQVLTHHDFNEHNIKAALYSAFNPAAAAELKLQLKA